MGWMSSGLEWACMRRKLVLCCRLRAPHHSASRSADRPQSRRGCAPVSAPSQRGPGADVNSSVTLCAGAHDCVRVRRHVRGRVIVHACAREPTACMIWRMQNTRVRGRRHRRGCVGRRVRRSRCRSRSGRVGRRVRRSRCRSRSGRVGRQGRRTRCRSRRGRRCRSKGRPACANSVVHVAAYVRPTIPLVAAQIGLSPGADVHQYRRRPSAVPAQM
jgi:hypothetical protein